ncbi:MAG: LysM peptidoglycan-binding domain-containing protein [Chloroflexota bacterium]
MPTCHNCNTQLDQTATSCHFCGVATEAQQQQRRCLNCGAAVAQNAQSCLSCQQPVDRLPSQALPLSIVLPIAGLGIVLTILVTLFSLPTQANSIASSTNTATPMPRQVTSTATNTPTASPTPTITPTYTPTPSPTPTPIIHQIRQGETLIFLADKYNVSVDNIIRANSISENTLLQLGQDLIIPAPNTIPGAVVSDGRTVIQYTIQEGDTLFGLALRYDVSLATLTRANPDIDLDFLSIGQKITIPLGGPILTVTPTPKPPTPTFTPGPPYLKPDLVWPGSDDVVEGDGVTVLLRWVSRELLTEGVYYVIFLTDEEGKETTFWTQGSSYSLPLEMKPIDLQAFTWYVVIMRQTGVDASGRFEGRMLSEVSETRRFLWR